MAIGFIVGIILLAATIGLFIGAFKCYDNDSSVGKNICLVLAIVCGLFYYFDPFGLKVSEIDTKEETIICVIELKDMDKLHSNSIQKGNDVVIVTNGVDVSEMIRVNKVVSSSWELSENGEEMVLVTHHDKDTVYVTVELKCTYKEGVGYFVHNQQLLIGNEIELRFTTFDAVGKCVSFEVKE